MGTSQLPTTNWFLWKAVRTIIPFSATCVNSLSYITQLHSFIFFTSSRPAVGTYQPPTQWIPGILSPGVKRQVHEGDHSPPAIAEVKKTWICTSTHPYVFMPWCLISRAKGQLHILHSFIAGLSNCVAPVTYLQGVRTWGLEVDGPDQG
jgi:hypothetical protein